MVLRIFRDNEEKESLRHLTTVEQKETSHCSLLFRPYEMSVQQVQSKGICHGLPVFPPDLSDLTAIVTGTNGISGYGMLRVLAESPRRWKKIYCLSRRPPLIEGGLPSNAEHIALDFLQTPDQIARVLKEKNVTADYVFFFSYIQVQPKPGEDLWSDAAEMTRVNALLIGNLLEALVEAAIKPKRFLLQTGAKDYGVHLGLIKVPQEESDPRVEYAGELNFYYAQEDLVFKYASEQGIGWNVTVPGPILGAVPDNAMNMAFPLAAYAAVCRHLGEPLAFPSDTNAWQLHCDMSSNMMNAYLAEWAVLDPKTANQKYNACDNSTFAWESTWPRIAGWYGIDWKGPEPENEETARYTESVAKFNPRGYGEKGVARATFTFVEWANRKEVAAAWSELAERCNLQQKQWTDIDRVFGFLDGTITRAGPLLLS